MKSTNSATKTQSSQWLTPFAAVAFFYTKSITNAEIAATLERSDEINARADRNIKASEEKIIEANKLMVEIDAELKKHSKLQL